MEKIRQITLILLGISVIIQGFVIFNIQIKLVELQKSVNCLNYGEVYILDSEFCYKK